MATYTAKSSGYLTAATAVTWTSGGPNSLGSNVYSALADEIDNSTTKYTHADMYMTLGSAAYTGAGSRIEVYLVPCVDGTNYPTWTAGGSTDRPENTAHYIGNLLTTASEAGQAMVLRNVELPPGKYKFAIRNRTGIALPASGNALSWRPYGYISTDA